MKVYINDNPVNALVVYVKPLLAITYTNEPCEITISSNSNLISSKSQLIDNSYTIHNDCPILEAQFVQI